MQTKSDTVIVIGIGRVGLPLGLLLSDKGFNVIGIDKDPEKILKLQKKEMPFIERGADEILQKNYGKTFSVAHEVLLGSLINYVKYIVITLGTPLNDTYGPDLSQILKLFDHLIPLFSKGQTIILRSTLSPGTTELIAKKLSDNQLLVGKDIFLAYCPERISEGESIEELQQIPQIIGVLEDESFVNAKSFFEKFSPECLRTDPRSAELAKLYSNMYRYIDFAIGNEFMMIAEDHNRDIYEIAKLVNYKYKRAGLKYPGLTAGPCLVKDGFFLIDKGPYLELVTAAWRINENVPGFLFNKLKLMEPNMMGKKVAILGLGFKRDIDDTRYALSYKFERHFLSEGATVLKHDPFIESDDYKTTIKDADIVIIAINHSLFKNELINDIKKYSDKNCIVCDIWNIFGVGKILFKVDEYFKDIQKNIKYTNEKR